MRYRHYSQSSRRAVYGGRACQKNEHGFLTASPGHAASRVGILFVSDVGSERPADQGSNRAKCGAHQEPKARTSQRVLCPSGGSRRSVHWRTAPAVLGSAVPSRASLLAPIAVDACCVEVVHPISAAARPRNRVLNLPSAAAARRSVVGVRQLLRAEVAITGGTVVDRFELVVCPGHLGIPGGINGVDGLKSAPAGQGLQSMLTKSGTSAILST